MIQPEWIRLQKVRRWHRTKDQVRKPYPDGFGGTVFYVQRNGLRTLCGEKGGLAAYATQAPCRVDICRVCQQRSRGS